MSTAWMVGTGGPPCESASEIRDENTAEKPDKTSKISRLGWRGGSLLWALGFLLAAFTFVVAVGCLFRLENLVPAARATPPNCILPGVPLCMFGAVGMVALCLVGAIPRAPHRVWRWAHTGMRFTAVAVLGAVLAAFFIYAQGLSGNAAALMAQKAGEILYDLFLNFK